MSYWFKIFIFTSLPDFPITEESGFGSLAARCRDFTTLLSLSAFLIILLAARNLRMLTTQFPSFGALFETVSIAKGDLGNIFMSIGIISLGFILTTCLLLGPYLSDSDDFIGSTFKTFKTYFGDQNVEDYMSDLLSVYISDILFITLMFVFNFILLKYTVSVVIVRYKYLREKIQLENETYAKIVKEDTLKIRQKWINLLLFRIPKRENEYSEEQKESMNEVDNETEEENKNAHYTLWTIFRLNLNSIKDGLPLQSRDEREKRFKDTKNKILKQKLQKQVDRANRFSPENFNEHKKSIMMVCYYLVYWILFILIIIWQLDITQMYQQTQVSEILLNQKVVTNFTNNRVEEATGTRPEDTYFDFYEIVETPEMLDWVSFICRDYILPVNQTLNGQNYYFGDPKVRLSVRRAKFHENKNPRTKSVISHVIVNRKFGFDDSLGSEELTEPITIYNGTVTFEHTPAGGRNSPREKGGYLFEVSAGEQNLNQLIKSIFDSNIFEENWVYFMMEFVYYNRNNDLIVDNDVIIVKSPVGITTQKFSDFTIADYYKNGFDYFRAFLEIVFVI